MTQKRSIFVWPFWALWKAFTWFKQFVVNAFFALLFIVLVAALFAPKGIDFPNNAPLFISPSGLLVDQYSYQAPASLLLEDQQRPPETRVKDLVDAIDAAAVDAQIPAIVLHLDYLAGGGISKLQEVGRAIERFKQHDKRVIAVGDNFTQQQYFLAAYADEILLNELGTIELTGFGLYRNYYKDAIDKLKLNFHIFKVGQYKDFIEPYTRNSMSAASREHNQAWLSDLWTKYTNHVEQQRRFEPGAITSLINSLPERLAQTEGDSAKLALESGLVDQILSRIDMSQYLVELFGPSSEVPDRFKRIYFDQYLAKQQIQKQFKPGNIGLITARGMIVDGYQPEGRIGSSSMSELIRRAKNDDSIKAVVVRIDSGGGSAFASEIIRQELVNLKNSGKPVVISMGSVAASGGYWMAMGANEIWASPATITGSIGVFGLFPTAEDALNKLGVYTDGFGTTDLAGAMRIDRTLPERAEQVIQLGVESIYEKFKQLVATSRNLEPEQVESIAQGRVWIGSDALELNLVDQLGSLNDAINAAARLANIDKPVVKYIERELSPTEQIIKALQKQVSTPLPYQQSAANPLVGALTQTLGLTDAQLISWSTLFNAQSSLAKNNTYALCLTCEVTQ